MAVLDLIITDAGYAALVNAQNTGTNAVTVSQVGVTDQVYVAAPTLEALPGEIKRLATVAGEATGPNTLNIVIRDDDAETYPMRGFALYLEDGVLFACHASTEIIVQKSALASILVTVDVALTNVEAASISFGDSTFTNPAATVSTKGVAELATAAEADALEDEERIVTPAALGHVLASREITGGGLVTGGGGLDTSRELTVTEASLEQTLGGDDPDTVITPRRLKAMIDAFREELLVERAGTWVWLAYTAFDPAAMVLASGQAISRADNPRLFAKLGITFGAGDGVTTFNVPEVRGEFFRALDLGRGVDAGRAIGSFQASQNLQHTHGLPEGQATEQLSSTFNGFASGDDYSSGVAGYSASQASGGDEARPRNTAWPVALWR